MEVLYNILIDFVVSMKLIKMCSNKTYREVRVGKHLADNFPFQNGLKQRCLFATDFDYVLEYPIKKVEENQVGLILNGTHQLLVCADDVNLLGDNIDTMKKNTETLIDAIKDVDLEVNPKKDKLLSREHNAGPLHHIKIAAKCFENVAQFRYLETTITNETLIQEEIKGRLNWGSSC
jgi:hypothetical protein